MMQSKQLLAQAVASRVGWLYYLHCRRSSVVWGVLIAMGIFSWIAPAVGQTGRLPKADYYINFANNAE